MGLILIFLILAVIFGAVGFAIHVLWIIAVVLFVCWAIGLAFGQGHRSAR